MADGYDGYDRQEHQGTARVLQLILREVALQSLRFDQLEDALHVSTAVGRARKKRGAALADLKAARADHEAKLVAELQAIVARQDEELLALIREDDEALDREAAGRG